MSKKKQLATLLKNVEQDWVRKNIQSATSLSKKPVEWLVDRMVLKGGTNMLAGGIGTKKSLLALYVAKAVSGALPGTPWLFDAEGKMEQGDNGTFLGRRILHGVPVLYIDRENPESVVNDRIEKIGLLGSKNFHYWGRWNDELTPEPNDPRVIEFAHRTKGLIIFDSLQDWYGNRKEIDNTQMIELIQQFNFLAQLGATILILHHDAKQPMKGKTQGYRGGTSIPGLADMSFSSSKNSFDSVELAPIRFRACGDWRLTYRVVFRPDFFELTFVSDVDASADAYAADDTPKVDKKTQDGLDLAAIEQHLATSPSASLRAIAEATDITKDRCSRILKAAGWVVSDTDKMWHKAPF